MTIDHRAEALNLLIAAREDKSTTYEGHNPEADRLIAEAQVHATLARDEEQAARTADMRDALRLLRGREYDVRQAVSTHIAKALASREPNRWKAGRELAQALDMADCNLDDTIDARLSDDGWDPRSAWKSPASAVPAAVPSSDPWAGDPWTAGGGPHIAGQSYSPQVETALRTLKLAGYVTPADTLTSASTVIAGHIAEALADGENEQVRTWARSLADELKRIGLNLHAAVESRAESLTGKPFTYDDEPPF